MQNINEVPTSNIFLNNTETAITNQFITDELKLFQDIKENFIQFSQFQSSPHGHKHKLAFISAILRDFEKNEIIVSQSFDGSILGEDEKTFECRLIVDPQFDSSTEKRNLILNKFSDIKKRFFIDDEEKSIMPFNLLPNPFIETQKHQVKQLFNQLYFELDKNEDAAIALTSYLLFEIENMMLNQKEQTLFFYDMYNLNNPYEKWFSAIDVSVKSKSRKLITSLSYMIH